MRLITKTGEDVFGVYSKCDGNFYMVKFEIFLITAYSRYLNHWGLKKNLSFVEFFWKIFN
jgi:hypothetical protein